MDPRRPTAADRRALALVVLAPALLWLLCWPFCGVGVNDDFSYAFTVKRLLETGRFAYNGWSSAMLVPQALWAAPFVWCFGFSHDVLRLSVLPLAAACGGLTYRLHRRLGVPVRWGVFATLACVTSPLFTPLAASFMTDVPGLVFSLLLFHAALSLAAATSRRDLAFAAGAVVAIGLIGGTLRQTNFAMAAAALGVAIWLRRADRRAAIALSATLVAHVVVVVALIRWNAARPYTVGERPFRFDLLWLSALTLVGFALSGVLVLLPVGVACVRVARFRRSTRVAAALLITCACVMLVWMATEASTDLDPYGPRAILGSLALPPWTGNTLTPTGLLNDGVDAPGERPIVFPTPLRIATAVGVYWTVAFGVAGAWRRRRQLVAAARRVAASRCGPREAGVAILLTMAAAYVALLLPRSSYQAVFDRYLLVLMPIASSAVLVVLCRRVCDATPGVLAWLALIAFAIGGVAITFDHFAELRARDRIAADLMRDGVPRTAIANGLTFDAWTQLEARGYVNDSRIVDPPGAYVPDPNSDARSSIFWYLPFTPAVEPRWVVVSSPSMPASLGDRRAYRFRALLPPRDRVLLAWPLRSAATTRPASTADASRPLSR